MCELGDFQILYWHNLCLRSFMDSVFPSSVPVLFSLFSQGALHLPYKQLSKIRVIIGNCETGLPSTGGVHLLCCTLSFSILLAEVLGPYTCYCGLFFCCMQTFNFLCRSLRMLVLSSHLFLALLFSALAESLLIAGFSSGIPDRKTSKKYTYFGV